MTFETPGAIHFGVPGQFISSGGYSRMTQPLQRSSDISREGLGLLAHRALQLGVFHTAAQHI